MRGIIEDQAIRTRRRPSGVASGARFDVGADIRSAATAPEHEPRLPSVPRRTKVVRLPRRQGKRRRILDAPRRSLNEGWRRASRQVRRVRSRRIALTPVTLPALVSVPIALFLAALLLGTFGYFAFYAYQNGFSLPAQGALEISTSAAEIGSESDGQPLSVDPRDFQAVHRTEYVVQADDTISGIAFAFDLNTGTLLSANPIDDVRLLPVGAVLSIPDRDGLFHDVLPGESLSGIAASYGVPVAPILDANDLNTAVLTIGDTLFIPGAEMNPNEYLLAIGELFTWPVRSFRFTSGYGMRSDPFTGEWRMHTGIDLANATGTPIYAALAGRVDYVSANEGNYGGLVIIDHLDGFRSLYAHLNSFNVRVGQRVTTNTIIGGMGNTGRSTGPHLHFSVYRNGRPEDPMKHLPPL